MAPIGKLYGPAEWNVIVQAVVATANFAGVEIETAPFEHFKDNQTPEYLAKFPMGKVPAFEGADGYLLTESTAIVRYIASQNPASGLLGTDARSAALVEQWVSFVEKEVIANSILINQVIMGLMNMTPFNSGLQTHLAAQRADALALLETHLTAHTFLVGERATIADVMLASANVFAVQVALGAAERRRYPALMRHLETMFYEPRMKGAFGPEIKYAEKALTYQPPQKEKKAQ